MAEAKHPSAVSRRLRRLRLADMRDYGIALSFILIFVFLSLASPVFLSTRNMLNVVDQSAAIGIIAAGETLVLIAGGLDLSVAAIFAVVGVVNASLAPELGVFPAVLVALLTGATLGLFNGILSTVGRINSIIATLATSIMYRGIAVSLTRGFLVTVRDPAFALLGRGAVGPIKYSSLIFLGSIVLAWFVLRRTAFGRYVYAVGGNAEAARLSGVRVNLVKTLTFIISGVTAGLAGVLISSRVATGQADAGLGMEISAIAAVVIGGTSVAGGQGAAWRTLFGVLLLTLIGNGFNLLNVNPIYQQAFTGAIILLAVAVDAWSRERE